MLLVFKIKKKKISTILGSKYMGHIGTLKKLSCSQRPLPIGLLAIAGIKFKKKYLD